MSIARSLGGIFSSVVREAKTVRSFGKSASLTQVQEAIQLNEHPTTAEWENADPYEAIPGPKALPIPKGNLWRFLPFGTYYNLDADKLYEKLYREYGQLIRLTGIQDDDIVVVMNPEDTEKMFRNESSTPHRSGLRCLDYYRTVVRKDLFKDQPGFTAQGEDWYKFRKIVNQPMLQPRSTKIYVYPIGKVSDRFVERIKRLRDSNMEMPKDFLHELEKWALESIAVIALDASLGCLEDNLSPDSDALKLVSAVSTMFDTMYTLEMKMSPWRYMWTPTYGKFIESMDTINLIARKHIGKKWEEIKNKNPKEEGNSSVLQSILLKSGNQDVAFTMATDMITAGIDTTSSAAANVLYFLASNPDKQEKLYKELRELMPSKDHNLTEQDLNEAKYLKACIKETHRISPVALGTQRKMMKDMVFSNYQVPKGTTIVCNNMMMCRMEKYFQHPDEYIPERWLKTDGSSELSASHTNSFVFLPFGFGPRMCVGRRFAELENQVLIPKIIRNFKVTYPYGEMTWKAKMLRRPAKPMKFRMEDRNE